MEDAQAPLVIPPYEPRKLTGSRRAGIKYKSYTQEEFENAMRAVQQGEMSLRKASMKFNVPKTTLAEKLGDSCPNLPPLGAKKSNKIGTRYTWTEAEMAQAIAAVQDGATVSDAARQFGVPPSNLNSRTRGREPKDLKGEVTRLTLKQESLLVNWASAQCELGFPPTKDEIYELAEKVLKKNGSDKSLGKQWVGHWLRRHPQIQALDWKPKPKEKRLSKSFDMSRFALTDPAEVETVVPESGVENDIAQPQDVVQHQDVPMEMSADMSANMPATMPTNIPANMTAGMTNMPANISANMAADMANIPSMSHMPAEMAHMTTEMETET